MLDHALAHLEGQVQAGEAGVALLEILDNPQGVQVMVETFAEALHLPVELFFAGVRERRMADIVSQGQRFRQSLIQLQNVGQRARNLRYLDGVGKAVAKVVGEARRKDLGLRPPAGERRGNGLRDPDRARRPLR